MASPEPGGPSDLDDGALPEVPDLAAPPAITEANLLLSVETAQLMMDLEDLEGDKPVPDVPGVPPGLNGGAQPSPWPSRDKLSDALYKRFIADGVVEDQARAVASAEGKLRAKWTEWERLHGSEAEKSWTQVLGEMRTREAALKKELEADGIKLDMGQMP
ncbi:hypothetical protein Rhopal_003073-T1 [Rhodotorula paludigena]|uniref:Uncharacterized protein n=1 Tax=Rhodotorula paludigena TaxID=86838 RepID=A0AAV5GKN6_9BASI|nr:hypothetical protein Rhopal_003073-T1 [Rhodotorula paludigena]